MPTTCYTGTNGGPKNENEIQTNKYYITRNRPVKQHGRFTVQSAGSGRLESRLKVVLFARSAVVSLDTIGERGLL
jgi:hypothetical protein